MNGMRNLNKVCKHCPSSGTSALSSAGPPLVAKCYKWNYKVKFPLVAKCYKWNYKVKFPLVAKCYKWKKCKTIKNVKNAKKTCKNAKHVKHAKKWKIIILSTMTHVTKVKISWWNEMQLNMGWISVDRNHIITFRTYSSQIHEGSMRSLLKYMQNQIINRVRATTHWMYNCDVII